MRLVLIDGHAVLHRAFHALPPQIKFNAVYGFTTMLLKALSDLKPDYFAVAFDLPAPNFRQQQYTQYQAKRPEMVSALSDQIPLVHEMLEALKIPYFEVPGFEADDCIGTLARQAGELRIDARSSKLDLEASGSKIDKNQTSTSEPQDPTSSIQRLGSNIEVYVVTGDRDMLQLVSGHVKVYVPIKGLSETKTYDEKTVISEFGVKPSQWVDVKALKGDASDNYGGVRGIGPKTACDLIAKYGTLENLYQHLDELKLQLKLKLAEGAESAGLGKKLAQIVTDVPGVKLQLDKVAVAEINWAAGVKYMRESLGFKSIPERIEREILSKASDSVTQSPNKSNANKTSKVNKNQEQQMKLI